MRIELSLVHYSLIGDAWMVGLEDAGSPKQKQVWRYAAGLDAVAGNLSVFVPWPMAWAVECSHIAS